MDCHAADPTFSFPGSLPEIAPFSADPKMPAQSTSLYHDTPLECRDRCSTWSECWKISSSFNDRLRNVAPPPSGHLKILEQLSYSVRLLQPEGTCNA